MADIETQHEEEKIALLLYYQNIRLKKEDILSKVSIYMCLVFVLFLTLVSTIKSEERKKKTVRGKARNYSISSSDSSPCWVIHC